MSSVAAYKHIGFIPFTQLYNWSVKYLLENQFSYNKKYPMVKMGSFLKRNKTPIEIKNGIAYKRVTIKINNGGIFLRDIEKGEKIGTKNQFVIKEGQFLLSKIDARNGAFGVVPKDLDGAIITGNFWTFDVDYSLINPHYLSLIATTKEFIQFCQSSSTGTTNRHYLQEDLFLNVEIPLPEIIKQEALINLYNQTINDSLTLQEEIVMLESKIKEELLKLLDVSKVDTQVSNSRLKFVRFKDVNRWDTLFLLGKVVSINSRYKIIKISDIIKNFMVSDNGASLRFESKKYPSKQFYYLGMEHVERDTGELIEMPTVKGIEIKSQTVRVPKEYFIYGKLRPYLNKYWLNMTDFDNIICSSEFFVFDIDESKVSKSFFKEIVSSDIIQEQIKDKCSGVRMPRLNSDDFKSLSFPAPHKAEQDMIIARLESIRDKIRDLKFNVKELRTLAPANFEKEIFDIK